MLKKILTLLMSLALILSLAACGGGTTTVKVTNEDGSTQTVVLESLKQQLQNATPLVDYAKNKPPQEMDTITFGTDENGKPKEWIVIEKEKNKALLFAKYYSSYYYYERDYRVNNWENSEIRKYLNEKWINDTFSKKEQNSIILSEVANEIFYTTWGGSFTLHDYQIKSEKNTKDKIFLLSETEVEKYFLGRTFSSSQPSITSLLRTVWISGGEYNCGFLLLESSRINDYERVLSIDCNYNEKEILPALWVKY